MNITELKPKEIAPMFKDALNLPNVVLHPNLLRELQK
jgi:hypothetical protein